MKKMMFATAGLLSALVALAQSAPPPQQKTAGRYWALDLGLSSQAMYDEGISYVRYGGSGLAPSLLFLKQNEKKYRHFVLRSSFVKLTTNRSNDLRPMEAKTTRVTVDYRQLRQLKQWNNRTKLYIGGDLSLLFSLKRAEQLDNSQLVYDYALSVGPAARLQREVNYRQRNCLLSFDARLPLLSHIARPYYLNRIEFIDPKNDFVGDLFSNSSLATVNKNFRLSTGIAITYPLFNGNALKLGYTWDYYRMKTINVVHHAEHLVSFAFLSNY